MIILEPKCTGLETFLKQFLEDPKAKPVGLAMVFGDFDDAQISFNYGSESEFTITLTWGCIKSFIENGSKAILEDVYKDLKLDIEDQKIVITVPVASVPTDKAKKDELINKLCLLKQHVFSGPFLRIMKGDGKSVSPLQIELKHRVYMWVIPTPTGGFTCGFSHTVSDRTDLPIAKVLYHEFNDSRRDKSLNASPQAISSAERPEDLKGMKFEDKGLDGYFLFTVTPKHYATPVLADKLIGQLMVFRSYLDYHFKCTKAFTHYRMRYTHENLVQVANRAKGEVKIGRGTKTFTGRNMKTFQ